MEIGARGSSSRRRRRGRAEVETPGLQRLLLRLLQMGLGLGLLLLLRRSLRLSSIRHYRLHVSTSRVIRGKSSQQPK